MAADSARVARPRRIAALRMDGEVSTETGRRRTAIKTLTGRRRRIIVRAPDLTLTALPRRAIADIAPPRQAIAVHLHITGPTLLRTQRRDTRRRTPRVFLLRDHSRRRITQVEVLGSPAEDTPGSQEDILLRGPPAGTRAEAAGAAKIRPVLRIDLGFGLWFPRSSVTITDVSAHLKA